MPAERAMELAAEDFKVAVAVKRRERVSDIVVMGEAARRRIRESIAAIGWVKRGSLWRRVL